MYVYILWILLIQLMENQQLIQAQESVSKFGQLLSLLHLPTSKTPHCRHKKGCLQAIILDSLRIGGIGYLIRAGISIIFGLKKILSKPKVLFTLLRSEDAIRFGLFISTFILLFRTILCALRRLINPDRHKYIPIVAGGFGGFFSSLWLTKSTRQSFGLFLLARAFDISYQNFVKKGYLPQFKYFYVVLYALMMSISGYAYGSEPGSMSREMNKFYLTFTNETLSDMQMRQIWIERKNNQLVLRGIPRQNPLQYMPKLKKYYQSLKNK